MKTSAKELSCAAHGISVAYNENPVLLNVNFAAPVGTITGIIGPNGAGKSTLIKAMLELLKPLSGTAEFFGGPLKTARSRVGYMPQSRSVDWDFPATVREIVEMGTYGSLGWGIRPGKKQRQLTAAALAQTDITDLAKRQIGELSGGQKQRVFLARCLAQNPDLLILDEPFQGIDKSSQQAIIAVLQELRDSGKTVVMVHHDLKTVPELCDRVLLLNGTVVAAGTVAEAFTAENIAKTFNAPLDLQSLGLTL